MAYLIGFTFENLSVVVVEQVKHFRLLDEAANSNNPDIRSISKLWNETYLSRMLKTWTNEL